MKKILFITILFAGLFFAKDAFAATNVYYSVGQSAWNHITGSPTLTIASGVGTFSVAQTASSTGVGDRVTYGGAIVYISSKIDTSNWNLVTATGTTPVATTSASVTSIIHEYTSLSLAEAGAFDADHMATSSLVAAPNGGDFILNIPCYYDSGADTTVVVVAGWTTGASNYIKIYTPNNTLTEVNQSQRHNGIAKSGANYTGFALQVPSGTWKYMFTNSQAYTRVDGLIVDLTASTASSIAFRVSAADLNTRFDHCIAFDDAGGAGDAAFSIQRRTYISNSLAYDFSGTGAFCLAMSSWSQYVYVYNFTATNCKTGILISVSSYSSVVLTNVLVSSSTIAFDIDQAYSSNPTITYCASSDATADDLGGAGNRVNQTFTFVNETNKDFHLSALSKGAVNQGTNLSNDANLPVTDDIDGQTRPAAGSSRLWDIGADQTFSATQINSPTTGYLTSGLVGNWSFNGADMNWNTNQAYDRSSSYATGTMTNMSTTTSPVPGISGQALSFDGVNDYVNLGTIDVTGTKSVSYWFKSTAIATTKVHIYLVNSGSEQNDFMVVGLAGSKILVSGATTSAYSAASSNALLSNTWYHVVVTKTTGDATDVYVNGAKVTAAAANSWGGAVSKFIIGGSWTAGSLSVPFSGLLDEVRVYNRALSQSEITDLYRLGSARLKINSPTTGYLTSGLVGEWSFNGADISWGSNTAYDRSGSSPANNGTITNMSTTTSPVPGVVGQALSFDGVDDYVDRGAGPTAVNTVAFWVYPKTTTEYFINLTSNTDYIWANAGVITATGFTAPVIYVNGQLSSTLTVNNWQFVVITDTTAENASNLDIGRTQDANYMEGFIDEVRIYNRALSTDEVMQLYNIGRRKVTF